MLDESDILYWINLISVPHDEWTDDTARIAMELVQTEELVRKNYKYYSEKEVDTNACI